MDRHDDTAATRWIPVKQDRLNSASLFRRTHRVVIEHRGEAYQLRRTRSGKLILTK